MKNYLVVGGSSGIGKAVVEILAKKDVGIWCASRASINEYDKWGVNYIELDVTSDDISKLTDSLPEYLNGLVYCPGTINLKPFQMLKIEDFLNDLNINLIGAVKSIRACQKKLIKSKDASVILFSTVAARIGMSYHASISVAKSAVEGLALSLAAEWARQNIRVNVIAPSLTDTAMAENLLSDDKRRNSSAERHPLKRIGRPYDIASAVVYLLDDNSSWITGQILNIDGGMSSLKPL